MSKTDKLKKAKLKMFRKDYGLRLFGARSYAFNWRTEDMHPNIEGCVKWNLIDKKFDGNIYINNFYLDKDDYTHDNLIALIIHELLHILHKHGERRGTRDPAIFALAADHIIDRDLREMKLIPYQNNFNIIPQLDYELPKCSLIEAYNWLNNKRNNYNIQQNNNDNNIIGFTIKHKDNNEEYNVTLTPDDDSKLTDEEKNELKQHVEQFISETRALHQIMKDKGDTSGKHSEYLERLLKVEIKWEDLLDKAIKTNVILKPNERSWRRLHKNYLAHNITLPGISYEEEKENIGRLIIGIDTSGSIDKTNLEKFSYILSKSLKYFEEVILLVHDIEVHQIETFQKEDFGKVYDFIKNVGFKGRGGTSHRPIFKLISNDYFKDGDDIDILSMIIFLTDLESDVESDITNHEWSKSVPTVFMSTSREYSNDDFPNISTIQIS